ncbi:hypothetical protein QJR30_07520 [Paraclostridium sordellii]|uniref:hypothetical protein n=1 Tax=Paraclostridium sordellii TaxID=1505 RepID=UPI0030CCDB09
MNELNLEILRKLEFGYNKLSHRSVKVEKDDFNKAVKELGAEGYVVYDDEDHKLFKGDVKHVIITEKGKKFILGYNK